VVAPALNEGLAVPMAGLAGHGGKASEACHLFSGSASICVAPLS
jgi:hypothetical protein